jgi:DNA-binding winged helix-turn-helix (wHTH) protein/tetratricopeptide (TPR) repeat protein
LNVSKVLKTCFEFGPFHLDAAERLLLRDGQPVALPPKVFDTLLVLVQSSGHLVEKDELMTKLWPDTFVEEATLARNISDLRKALSEDTGQHQYIETVPKRGYRFVASVKFAEADTILVQRRSKLRTVVEEVVEATSSRSLAVLPFKPLGPDDDDDYLGLGIADALISRLSNVRQILVRPTSSVFKYVGSRQDPIIAGRELRVDSVVDGSVQMLGDRIRVTVQLVSVADEASLWAEQLDVKFTDIFAVEDSISQRVVEALTVRLTGEERKLLSKHHTENTEAYQAYLRGRYFLNKRTTKCIKKAAEYFQQAIQIDPTYAFAYAGLADSLILLVTWEPLPPLEGFPKAEAAAARALEIDHTLAEAHASMGHLLLHSWHWEDAERSFMNAIELNPGYASAHQWYSEYLAAMGRFDEAIARIHRAQELDPLSPVQNSDVGWVLYYARRYDEAIDQLRHAVEMDPEFLQAHVLLGQAYTQKAMYEEAIAEFDKAMELSGKGRLSILLVGHVYAVSGRTSEALATIDKLHALSKQRYFSPYRVALIHAGLGDNDQAFDWLERGYQKRDAWLIWLKVDPALDRLRGDQRFPDLLNRVGLAP